jgi:hypothetical protein
MTEGPLKRAYLAAAAAAAGITFFIVVYTLIVEALKARGYAAPLVPPASYALKYALYAVAVSALVIIKLAEVKLGGKKDSPEAGLRSITALAIIKAAAGEVPAVAGLLLFLLGGFRQDFYLLAVFSLGLEAYHFPRLAAWEEKLRADFGQL